MNKIKGDIEAGNLLQAVEDGKAAIPDLKQCLTDCKDVKNLAEYEGDVKEVSGIF